MAEDNDLRSKDNDISSRKSSQNKDNSDINTNNNLNELSQDEIDSLIKSSSFNSNNVFKPETKDENEDDSASLDLISQDDINRLMHDTESSEKDTVVMAEEIDLDSEIDFNHLMPDALNQENQDENVKIKSETKENTVGNSAAISPSNLTSNNIDDLDKDSLYDIKINFDKNNFKENKTIIENFDASTLKKIRDKQKHPSENNNSKKVLSYILIAFILVILLPAGYFSFFYKLNNGTKPFKLQINADQKTKTNFMPVSSQSTGNNPKISVVRNSGDLELKNFLILTSDGKNDIVYITADILIRYTNKQAYNKIMNHTAFYRNIIYDAMKKSIEIENTNKIVKKYLSGTIKATLNTAIKAQYIDKVTFISFETG